MKKAVENIKKPWVVCLGALLCCFLWGSAFPFIKTGYRLFKIGGTDTSSQILFAGCRFALAGILVILFGSILQKKFLKPKKSSVSKIINLSMVQTVIQYVFFYIGLAHTTGVKGSVVVSSSVFVTILLSSLLFKMEKLTVKKVIGCIILFGGVVLINLNGMSIDFNLLGDGFIFFSAVAYAVSSILIKKYSADENAVMLSGYQFFLGGIIMIAIALLTGGRLHSWTINGVLVLLYTACLSAVAYTLWGILLKYNPVSHVSIFGFSTPVFGVLLSTFILKEGSILNAYSIIALISVCAGILLVNKESRKDKKTL